MGNSVVMEVDLSGWKGVQTGLAQVFAKLNDEAQTEGEENSVMEDDNLPFEWIRQSDWCYGDDQENVRDQEDDNLPFEWIRQSDWCHGDDQENARDQEDDNLPFEWIRQSD